MKKEYVKPEAETVDFNIEDVLMNEEDDDFDNPGGNLSMGGDFDW